MNLIVHISIAYFASLLLLQKVFGFYLMILFPFLAMIAAYSITRTRLKADKNILVAAFLVIIAVSSIISSAKFIKYDFQDFKSAKEISDFISTSSKEDEAIFGDDSAVPLIALLSNRRIALNYSDLNNLRFRSGIDDINKLIADLRNSNNRFIIIYQLKSGKLTGTYGLGYIDEFSNYVERECALSETFKERWNNYEKVFSVYDCKKKDDRAKIQKSGFY